MRYPHVEAELNLAYTRGEELAPDEHGRWVAAGIAAHATALLDAMVADGILRSWLDDSGRPVYMAQPRHSHDWKVGYVGRHGDFIDLYCDTCDAKRAVSNRLPIEVPE